MKKRDFKRKILFLLPILISLTACAAKEPQVERQASSLESKPERIVAGRDAAQPNYLLMIGDDIGLEALSCYNIGQTPAYTPHLDELCNSGLRFDNFYTQPACTPTRATLLTGQYGFANGVGVPIHPLSNAQLGLPPNPDERIIPAELLTPGLAPDAYTFVMSLEADTSKSYATAAIGKWHLADGNNGGVSHPLSVGFDYFSGPVRGGGVESYFSWLKSVNGAPPEMVSGYVTTDTVDDGIAWLRDQPEDAPWFMWMAFNAPHTPFHLAPSELLSSDLKDILPEDASESEQYKSMVEAMDTEIGRLLDSLDPATRDNTYVIFMGDNGTPGQVAEAPFSERRAKGSIHRGGINVPFFLTGPNVKTGTTPALANSVDLFATIMELSEIAPDVNAPERPFHSISLAPVLTEDNQEQVRSFAFSEWFGRRRYGQVNLQTIRNLNYKLVIDLIEQTEQLYFLDEDPNELEDLMAGDLSPEASQNLEDLKTELSALLATAE